MKIVKLLLPVLIIASANCFAGEYALLFTSATTANAMTYVRVSTYSTAHDNWKCLTYEAWIKPNLPTTHESHIFNKNGGNNSKLLGTDYTVYLIPWGRARNGAATTGTIALVNNQWQHIAMTWTTATFQVHIFVNGIESGTPGTGSSAGNDSGWPFYLGVDPNSGIGSATGGGFAGYLDEVRISSTVRYASNFTPPAEFVADSMTVVLYHFNEGSGTEAYDYSGNFSTGIITNGSWATGAPLYEVTNTTDNPASPPMGSLRWCINNANKTSNKTITFNIPTTDSGYNQFGDGAFIIRVTTPLPNICGPGTTIDGSTQRANKGNTNANGPEIAVWGASITWTPASNAEGLLNGQNGAINGISISTQNVTVRELVISSFAVHGVFIDGLNADSGKYAGNINIKGCYIGVDPAGTLYRGNAKSSMGAGISIARISTITIGGLDGVNISGGGGDGNVISGQTEKVDGYGIYAENITVGSVTVLGNYIGVDKDAGSTVKNTRGIYQGACNDMLIMKNVIAGNEASMVLSGSSATVRDNFIGTDKTGVKNLNSGGIYGGAVLGWSALDSKIINNVIRFTDSGGYGGIYLNAASKRVRISSNSITNNVGEAIILEGSANNAISSPCINSATTLVIKGTAPVYSIVEVFISSISSLTIDTKKNFGQPLLFIGSTTADAARASDGDWTLTLWSPYTSYIHAGDSVTATAYQSNNGTSKYCVNYLVSQGYDSYTVINTTDNPDNPPDGSLRKCINNANASSNKTISFNIPTTDPGYNQFGDGAFIIRVTSPLPNICGPGTTIDGSTQRANKGNTNTNGPEIAVWGASITWATTEGFLLNGQNGAINGISISTQNVTIRELVISSFAVNGIYINGTNADTGKYAGNINIKGCYIGVDPAGTLYRGNAKSGYGIGISVNSCSTVTIGGLDGVNIAGGGGDGNVVSGHTGKSDGYGITADNVTLGSVTVLGNYIGVDKDAGSIVKNTRGIFQGGICNNMLIMKNVIAGGSANIVLNGSSATVRDNFIGTDKTGVKNLNLSGGWGGSVQGWSALDSKIINNVIRFASENGFGAINLNDACRRVRISSNSITNNVAEAIVLEGSANNAISSPCINSATTLVIKGTAPVYSIVEVFISSISSLTIDTKKNFGQPLLFIGSTTADAARASDGDWTLTLWSPYSNYITAGSSVTATAYQSNNGTSKYCSNYPVNTAVNDAYTVTNTTDNPDNPPDGSLRKCINNANALPNKTITFNIPTTDSGYNQFGDGAFIIRVTTPLPNICGPGTTIDGSTQRANKGNTNPNGPEIAIWGASITWTQILNSQALLNGQNGAINGLSISTQNVTIRELVISSFTVNGIIINGNTAGSGAYAGNINIKGCYVGVDPTGTLYRGNAKSGEGTGIFIANCSTVTVGGLDGVNIAGGGGDGNVVSGQTGKNDGYGIYSENVTLGSVTVLGNYIGVDKDAGSTVKNTRGIYQGQTCNNMLIMKNVIAGNEASMVLSGSSATVRDNFIGTDKTGVKDLNGGAGYGGSLLGWGALDSKIINNVIRFTKTSGIGAINLDTNCSRVRISSNSITNNFAEAIVLEANANNNISSPSITSANTNVIAGKAPVSSIVEVFISSISSLTAGTILDFGQPLLFVGSTTADAATGNWTLNLWSPYRNYITAGSSVTATAYQSNNGTSKYCVNYPVTQGRNCPQAIIDFTASQGANAGEVDLAWTATGDHGTAGTASSYEVKYTTVGTIIDDDFEDDYFNPMWVFENHNTALAGSYSETAGSMTVTGEGLFNTSGNDKYSIVYTTVTGDFDYKAVISSQNAAYGYSGKAGIMVRNSTATAANNAVCFLFSRTSTSDRWTAIYDADNNGLPDSYIGAAAGTLVFPTYLRLKKTGSALVQGATFWMYYSTDGSAWTLLFSTHCAIAAKTQIVGMQGNSSSTGNLMETRYGSFLNNMPLTDATGEPATAASGTQRTMTVSGLTAGATYFFSIKTISTTGFKSDCSNSPSAFARNADPYIVTNTTDNPTNPPDGSLRKCINNANKTSNNTISFNIPTTDSGYNQFGDGAFIIRVTSPLPNIVGFGTTIDGSTQRANKGNTNPNGPEIAVWGASITWNKSTTPGGNSDGSTNGLFISTGNVTIRELVISSFTKAGIYVYGDNINFINADNINIKGCYIGLNPKGDADYGNKDCGICLWCSSITTIGGPGGVVPDPGGDGNVISGNGGNASEGKGIVTWALVGSMTVVGNYIGTDKNGTSPIGNDLNGIDLNGAIQSLVISNVISGNGSGAGNGSEIYFEGVSSTSTIIYNYIGTNKNGSASLEAAGGNCVTFAGARDWDAFIGNNVIAYGVSHSGVSVGNGGYHVRISSNAIFANKKLGINLGDSETAGPETANHGILHPCVTTANTVLIAGTAPVNSIVEVFVTSISALTDSSLISYGQGKTYVGSTTANGTGDWSLTLWSPYTNCVVVGASVTATATSTDSYNNGDTSEFGVNTVVGYNISLTVDTTFYAFRWVPIAGSSVAFSSITVTNNGGTAEKYSLKCTTTTYGGSPWTPASSPGADQFRLKAIFKSTPTISADFSDSNDVITNAYTACTSSVYTKDTDNTYNGASVPAANKRNLWFMLDMPLTTSTTWPQTMSVTIKAEQSP